MVNEAGQGTWGAGLGHPVAGSSGYQPKPKMTTQSSGFGPERSFEAANSLPQSGHPRAVGSVRCRSPYFEFHEIELMPTNSAQHAGT
jgi:hypothetical protein